VHLFGGVRCSIAVHTFETSLVKPADKAKRWLMDPHLSLLALTECAMPAQ
jgi:hypothetical protein